jgi:membrane glycosyltransferase
VTAISLLRRFWWAPVIAGLIFYVGCLRLTVAHQETSIVRYGAIMTLTGERIAHARDAAALHDTVHARAVETAQAKATQETENALIPAIDAARADAARYAGQLRDARAQAARSGSGQPNLPYASLSPADLAPADQKTELDDAVACAEGVTKAEGWQDMWKKITAILR